MIYRRFLPKPCGEWCGEWCGERKRAYRCVSDKPLISLVRNARIELAAFSSGG